MANGILHGYIIDLSHPRYLATLNVLINRWSVILAVVSAESPSFLCVVSSIKQSSSFLVYFATHSQSLHLVIAHTILLQHSDHHLIVHCPDCTTLETTALRL